MGNAGEIYYIISSMGDEPDDIKETFFINDDQKSEQKVHISVVDSESSDMEKCNVCENRYSSENGSAEYLLVTRNNYWTDLYKLAIRTVFITNIL